MKRAKNDVRALNATPATPSNGRRDEKRKLVQKVARGLRAHRARVEESARSPLVPGAPAIESVMLADGRAHERAPHHFARPVRRSLLQWKTRRRPRARRTRRRARPPRRSRQTRDASRATPSCPPGRSSRFRAIARPARRSPAFDRALSSPIERRRSRGASPSSDRGYRNSGRSERSTSSSSSASSASSSSSSSSAKKSRASPSLSHRLGAAKTFARRDRRAPCTMGPSGPTAVNDPTRTPRPDFGDEAL